MWGFRKNRFARSVSSKQAWFQGSDLLSQHFTHIERRVSLDKGAPFARNEAIRLKRASRETRESAIYQKLEKAGAVPNLFQKSFPENFGGPGFRERNMLFLPRFYNLLAPNSGTLLDVLLGDCRSLLELF